MFDGSLYCLACVTPLCAIIHQQKALAYTNLKLVLVSLCAPARWLNQLNPAVKKGAFTPEEDQAIVTAHNIYGNKWATIAKLLPGR